MLKKIIKTHTARLDFVDIIKPTFLRNAVTMNRQRRVIASDVKSEKVWPISFWQGQWAKTLTGPAGQFKLALS